MWISRKKYKELKEKIETLEEEKRLDFWNWHNSRECDELRETIDELYKAIGEKDFEIIKYKSLYMDEHQKRLELVELYRLQELDN